MSQVMILEHLYGQQRTSQVTHFRELTLNRKWPVDRVKPFWPHFFSHTRTRYPNVYFGLQIINAQRIQKGSRIRLQLRKGQKIKPALGFSSSGHSRALLQAGWSRTCRGQTVAAGGEQRGGGIIWNMKVLRTTRPTLMALSIS